MIEYKILDVAVGAESSTVKQLNQCSIDGWRLVSATRSEKRALLFLERPSDFNTLSAALKEQGQ
jgi:hypothetical protein